MTKEQLMDDKDFCCNIDPCQSLKTFDIHWTLLKITENNWQPFENSGQSLTTLKTQNISWISPLSPTSRWTLFSIIFCKTLLVLSLSSKSRRWFKHFTCNQTIAPKNALKLTDTAVGYSKGTLPTSPVMLRSSKLLIGLHNSIFTWNNFLDNF